MAANKRKFPIGKCTMCGEDGFSLRHGRYLCAMHSLIEKMRSNARLSNKVVPSRQYIETIFPKDWLCSCGARMVARRDIDARRVASLQHYRDGSMGIVCLSCNSRHGSMPGDDFLKLPKAHKLCSRCNLVKPIMEFGTKVKTKNGRSYPTYCKPCIRSISKESYYRRKNVSKI